MGHNELGQFAHPVVMNARNRLSGRQDTESIGVGLQVFKLYDLLALKRSRLQLQLIEKAHSASGATC